MMGIFGKKKKEEDNKVSSTDVARLKSKNPRDWTSSDVGVWLEHIELKDYKLLFIDNAISGAELLELSEEDLDSLNITKFGHRKKLISHITSLREGNNMDAWNPGSVPAASNSSATGTGSVPSSNVSSTSSAPSHGNTGGSNTPQNNHYQGQSFTTSDSLSSEGQDPDEIHIKCYYEDDIRKLTMATEATFQQLVKRVSKEYNMPVQLKYKDDEGDLVTMRKDSDLRTAKTLAKGSSIKVYVAPDQQQQQQQVQPQQNYQPQQPQQQPQQNYQPQQQAAYNNNNSQPQQQPQQNYQSQPQQQNYQPQQPQQQQQGLSISPDRYNVLDSILDTAIVIDDQGIVIFFNKAAEKTLGYTKPEVVGRNVKMLMPSSIGAKHDQHIQNYLRTGQAKAVGKEREVVAQKKDGTLVPMTISLTEERIGNRRAFTGTMRKQEEESQPTEKSILEQERDVVNNLAVPGVIIDHEGTVQGFNKAAGQLFGYSLMDILGKNVKMLIPPSIRDKHDQYLATYARTGVSKNVVGKTREVVAQHQDGRMLNVFLSVTERKLDDGKNIFTGIFQPKDTNNNSNNNNNNNNTQNNKNSSTISNISGSTNTSNKTSSNNNFSSNTSNNNAQRNFGSSNTPRSTPSSTSNTNNSSNSYASSNSSLNRQSGASNTAQSVNKSSGSNSSTANSSSSFGNTSSSNSNTSSYGNNQNRGRASGNTQGGYRR